MVVWGETAPHLLNLARYNIVNKRPEVAQRFINLLKQSLFYRGDAEELENNFMQAVYRDCAWHLKTIRNIPHDLQTSSI